MKKTMSRALSVILAVVMLAVSMPVAFAAETLKASNVSQWPTLTYKNADGVVHYGQTLEEALIINDDEIVLDANGNQVAGHFEFMKPELISTPKTGIKANIKFVPDNTDEYTGFNKLFSSLLYDVVETTPVYTDEVNDPVVATEVEAGATLSTSTLSGGKMTNPYNAEEPNILEREWEWTNPNEVVNQSGYYEARFVPIGYTVTTAQVYVRIAGSVPETTIAESPSVPELTYDGVTTWGDIKLEGGKAVLTVEGTEVEGVFAVTEFWKTRIVNPGSYEIDVVFTPNDPEAALSNTFKVPVKVNKASIAFVDDEGNVVEDFTFEVEPGVKMNDVKALIQANLRVPKNAVISVEDNNGYAQNGRKYKLTVLHDDPNYEGTELYFTIKFKETEITPTLKWVAAGKLKVDCGEYAPLGTFTVYYVVGETETKIGDVKGNSEILEWAPASSGNYNFKVVYNPAENDYFVIKNVTTTPYSYYPEHNVISTGNMVATYKMGETATVTAVPTDPAKLDKPYYGFTGWTDVKGNTGLSDEALASETVSFTMPDEDVELKANYKFSIKLFFKWVLAQITQFFTFIVNAVKDLIALV